LQKLEGGARPVALGLRLPDVGIGDVLVHPGRVEAVLLGPGRRRARLPGRHRGSVARRRAPRTRVPGTARRAWVPSRSARATPQPGLPNYAAIEQRLLQGLRYSTPYRA